MEKPVSTTPHLPNPALPAADWADCYEIEIRADVLSAIDATRMAIGRFPLWVRLLMQLRNAAVGVVGLKAATDQPTDEIEMIGIFPVVSRADDEVVLGFDDRHLDFRIVMHVRDAGHGRKIVSATTLVRRKILLGRIYIAFVTPFHKLIVKTTLMNLGRRLAVSQSTGVTV